MKTTETDGQVAVRLYCGSVWSIAEEIEAVKPSCLRVTCLIIVKIRGAVQLSNRRKPV